MFSGLATAQEATAEETGELEAIPEASEVSVPAKAEDQEIRDRLNAIFQSIDDLKAVQVKVHHGVVTLGGPVPNIASKDEALALAKKTEGAIYVRDRMEQEVEVQKRLKPALERGRELLRTFIRKLPLILIALAVVVLFWLLARFLGSRQGIYQRLGLNDLSANLLSRVVRLGLTALGIFIALEILDATAIATGILGVAGVAGVALGFAFRNIVENYLAGILLSLRNPFATNDLVEIGEHLGKVVRLTSRDTVLMTLDGNHLRIPNSVIITSALTNYTRNPLRRFDFGVGVSTDLDLADVRALGLRILSGIESVLTDPAPMATIDALGDSTVNMRFYGWVDQERHDFSKTQSEAIRLLKEAFDDADIEMPEPIYRVHLHQADAVKPPSKRPAAGGPEEPLDLAPDRSIDNQVARDHAADPEGNLLNS